MMSFERQGWKRGGEAGRGKGAGPGTPRKARNKVSNKDPAEAQSRHKFSVMDIMSNTELQNCHCTDTAHSLSP